MIARTRIGLENEAAAEKDSERRTQEGACADMRTKRMLQNQPGSERGHQPQPRRALWALESASHSSDALGGLPLAAKLRELLVRSGIRGEEGGLILREPLAMDLEAGIRLEDRVG
eukprot:CAMPEP_0204229572 /NCGR_PEP_ID=MMETSP0361-20130328/87304_1 /ASSEMBLY_ACC=CAM_ASM_000343 /TAXON_ID=268821 /ORGANISM="Scrippsiella Hangoei, Strain SHTV-5" /LENGTH=114 /DNA_ID=CAMNT_0051198107 /DNA_START=139 /DNA_END=480 /DNA_ORIENTATION=+